MLKLSKKKYKTNKGLRHIVKISRKDIIKIKKVNSDIVIIAYFDNEPENTFMANIIKNGLIIRVNRNIPAEKVMPTLANFWNILKRRYRI